MDIKVVMCSDVHLMGLYLGTSVILLKMLNVALNLYHICKPNTIKYQTAWPYCFWMLRVTCHMSLF